MKAVARLLLVAGAVAIGLWLSRAAPRDVVLVYGLGDRAVRAVDVEIARDGRVVRRSELRGGEGAAGSLRHPVRLTDGEYLVRLRIDPRAGPPLHVERPITVIESGTIVLPLEAASASAPGR